MAVHQELIKSESFDIKFKNLLRDYYSYGFKNGALEYDRKRLDNILKDYVRWEDSIRFLSLDSQSMPENLFHRIYHFCSYNSRYPVIFLHTLAVLSDQIRINSIEDLDINEEEMGEREGSRLGDILYAYGKCKVSGDSSVLLKDLKWKTADLLFFYPKGLYKGPDKNKSLNERLDDLARVGIVQLAQNQGKNGGPGDRCWFLPNRTLTDLLQAGVRADRNFERHFRSAVEFYRGYFPFGEVGMYLADRMGEGEEVKPFRFKHQYFMHACNDVNRIDLLRALEEKKWCLIKYRHGTAEWETTLLCYPLEIRSSAISGREYIMFYEPFHRSYSGLRIEFIDSISCFEDATIWDILLNTKAVSESSKIDSDICNSRDALKMTWGVSAPGAENGNAVSPVTGRAVELRLKFDPKEEWYIVQRLMRERRFGHVTIEVRKDGKAEEEYDPEKDGDIRGRLTENPEFSEDRPGARSGKEYILLFCVTVTDPVELIQFVRSFYKRIVFCSGIESNAWSIMSDAAGWYKALTEPTAAPKKQESVPPGDNNTTGSIWSVPGKFLEELEKYRGKEGSGEHEKLFHEVFSIYYQILGDLFTRIASSGSSRTYSKADILELLENSFKRFQNETGRKTKAVLKENICEILIKNHFLAEVGDRYHDSSVKMYRSVYRMESGRGFYRDVVPLSEIEVAWLKTILNDSMIKIFLNDLEIVELRKMLDDPSRTGAIKPFPLEHVEEYDRFRFRNDMRRREYTILPEILTGIYEHRVLRLRYKTGNGDWRGGKYCPIIVEFDMRSNRFQGYFISCKTGDVQIVNIAEIRNILLKEERFDYQMALDDLKKYRARKETVEIEFSDEENLPDRILTAFSPFEKVCIYDRQTGKYYLKITYQKRDRKDIVIRLMGYGAKIHYLDINSAVACEVRNRLEAQMNLVCEQGGKI